MIAIYGRSYPELPETLKVCVCKRGSLQWDGHFAWRCNRTGCKHGVSLEGIFQHEDLPLLFEHRQVDLMHLPFTPQACTWEVGGEIALGHVHGNRYVVKTIEYCEQDRRAVQKLMRNAPEKLADLRDPKKHSIRFREGN